MNPTAQQIPQPLIPHQPPSPPSIEQRTRPLGGGNEAQGKFLLEQLMSGCVYFLFLSADDAALRLSEKSRSILTDILLLVISHPASTT